MNSRSVGVLSGVLLMAAASSSAAPVVYDAVGLRITEQGLGFLEDRTAQLPLQFQKPSISQVDVKCFDQVGINNLVVDSFLDSTVLDWEGSPEGLDLTARIDFVDFAGQIFGADDDFWDLCPSFSVTIQELFLQQVTFTANIRPYVDDQYNVFVAFNEPPQLEYEEIFVDVDGWADYVIDLVLSIDFIQGFLEQKLNAMLSEKVPSMVQDALFEAMFRGSAGPLDYAVGLASIEIDDGGATTLVDMEVDHSGSTPPCMAGLSDTPSFEARGTPGLGEYGDDSMAELSVADGALNEVLWAAWKSGAMCFDSESKPLEAFEQVLEGINPEAGDLLKYHLVIGKSPEILFEEGSLSAKLRDFNVEAWTIGADGEQKLLLRADADLSVGILLEVEVETNRVLLSLDSTNVRFDAIESEVLFSDAEKAEEDLKAFISGYVLPRMENKFQNHAVTNSIFPAQDYLVMLDRVNFRHGYAVAGATLYAADDPAVNHVAPNTRVSEIDGTVKRTRVSIDFSGTDDEPGKLVFSWQIDGGGWSTWSDATTAELTALPNGDHEFEVRARDRWQNVDPTPARTTFRVAAEGADYEMGGWGCGCSLDQARPTPPASLGAAASLLAAVAVGIAIRRRRA